MMDPTEEASRLRQLLAGVAPAALAAFDAWASLHPAERPPRLPIDAWEGVLPLVPVNVWRHRLTPEHREHTVKQAKHSLLLRALNEGAIVIGFSDPEQGVDPLNTWDPDIMQIRATGYIVRPAVVGAT